MRVRTGRFEKLRSYESGYAKAIEISYGQHLMQFRSAGVPPTPASGSHLYSYIVGCSKVAQTAIDRGATFPLLKLNRSEPSANP